MFGLGSKWWHIERKASLFKRVFAGRDGEAVLAELAAFAHLTVTTAKASPITQTIDPSAMLIAEGRRQVLLHITDVLGLTYDDIARMRYNEEQYGQTLSPDTPRDLS